jgi:hypothetical protein
MTIDQRRRIKAIETRYNGQLYRSRCEARWAVVFDALSIKYVYEIEGFDVDGQRYLPDFLLPEQWLWAEVKSSLDADAGGVARWRSFVAARGERGVLLTDIWAGCAEFTLIGGQPDGGLWEHDGGTWLVCPDGYHFDVQAVPAIGCQRCRRTDAYWYASSRIESAFEHARSYRFERG